MHRLAMGNENRKYQRSTRVERMKMYECPVITRRCVCATVSPVAFLIHPENEAEWLKLALQPSAES